MVFTGKQAHFVNEFVKAVDFAILLIYNTENKRL